MDTQTIMEMAEKLTPKVRADGEGGLGCIMHLIKECFVYESPIGFMLEHQ